MDETRYLTDEEIESQYKNAVIRQIKFYDAKKSSGFIDIIFPFGEDKVDNFIIYDDGRIAFDNWYPEPVYHSLCLYIKNNLTAE